MRFTAREQVTRYGSARYGPCSCKSLTKRSDFPLRQRKTPVAARIRSKLVFNIDYVSPASLDSEKSKSFAFYQNRPTDGATLDIEKFEFSRNFRWDIEEFRGTGQLNLGNVEYRFHGHH